MKYDRSAPVRIGHISDLSTFVTDMDPPAAIRTLCNEHGVAVEVVDPSQET